MPYRSHRSSQVLYSMKRCLWRMLAPVCALALAGEAGHAQDRVRVHAGGEQVSAEFTLLTWIVELPDSRVLVLDRTERVVSIVDFTRDAVRPVASVGSGPGEYGIPSRLLPMPDGGAVIDDALNQRWLRISSGGLPTGLYVLGDDGGGALVQRRATGFPFGSGGINYEMWSTTTRPLLRWSGGSSEPHQVTRRAAVIPLVPTPVRGSGELVRAAPASSLPPFLTPADVWTASPDGWVAVVSSRPYQVVIYAPDGTRRISPEMQIPRVRLTDETRRAQVRELARLRGDQAARDGNYQWPDSLPPFEAGALRTVFFAPDGTVWVRRVRLAEQGEMYDVFSRSAALIRHVELGTGVRLLGVGRRHVYLVSRDSVDIERLTRARLP